MLYFEILENTIGAQKTEEKLGEKYTKRREENIAMKVNSSNNKTLQIFEKDELLGELIYKNIFFLVAQVKLHNSEIYDIKPIGFWGTRISVSHKDTEVANLQMTWRGQILLNFSDGQEYVLKTNGWMGDKFIIEDKDGKEILALDAKFNWKKFYYNYDLSSAEKQDPLFVLLAVYASNYYLSSMSGTM